MRKLAFTFWYDKFGHEDLLTTYGNEFTFEKDLIMAKYLEGILDIVGREYDKVQARIEREVNDGN